MRNRNTAGVTILEVIVAMLIIGLVATGIMTAFVFSRQTSLRAGSELSSMGFAEEISEQLRAAIGLQGTAIANGLKLKHGVYVDDKMFADGPPPGAEKLPAPNPLNLPPDFQARYQTNADHTPAASWAGHGDGRLYVVEDAPHAAVDLNGDGDTTDPGEPALSLEDADLDDDGLAGIDFDNDGKTDLQRVRVKVRFTTPSVQ